MNEQIAPLLIAAAPYGEGVAGKIVIEILTLGRLNRLSYWLKA